MNAAFSPRFNAKLVPGCIALFLALASTAGIASALPAIKVVRGANQQTTYGSDFPAPLVVRVTEPLTGREVSGLRINFTPSAGIGLSSTHAITDKRGLAYVTASGLAACASNVRAEISEVPGARATFAGLVVDRATLTVVPADLTARPRSSVPAIASYTITGFVNGDTEESAHITGSPVLTTTATDHSPHANYAIKGGVGTLFAPNYTFVAGFGTLAILTGPNSADQQLEASIVAPPKEEEVVEVRHALDDQFAAVSANESVSSDGGSKISDAQVHSAVEPISPVVPEHVQASHAHSALLVIVAADTRKASDVPVRAAALPKLAVVSAHAENASTRSALPPVEVSTVTRTSDAAVRTAISPALTPAATAQSSYTQPTIRKAFNPPGTN